MLRSVLLILGVALTSAALVAAASGHMPAAWHLVIPGLVLLLAMLNELRRRYKPIQPSPPGPGWIETPERFVDPETGKDVTVYYRPSSGERRYVGR
ncbi:MAG TPA: hypothetical protein VLX67_00625 [Stellaceae bacterium]|nr:hypothetical protein [Stellaceae bacterium]